MRIEVVEGDITALDVDAIANAANDHLWMGAGVAGAIKRAGGEEIEREATSLGPIAKGSAVATGAGRLKAKHVIHGAVMGQDLRTDADLVERTTRSCLEVAEELGARSLALPAFGTGVGGFPLAECARIMVEVVRAHEPRALERVLLAVYGGEAERAFAAVLFGPVDGVVTIPRVGVKGLIAAGGEATRLGELTRATNKHLLPVGRWPMIYYPLKLLQLAGIREVLVVTGKGHAGQMIDLLGDGHLTARGSSDPLLELDLTYKVQTRPGGIAQVVGMARAFAGGDRIVVVLGDNIFEYAHSAEIRTWAERESGAQIFVKDVPDPESFGVVVYEDGRVVDIVEKAGVVDTRYDRPPTSHAVVGLYCYPPGVFDVIDTLEPSSRGELEITDVNRFYASRGELEVCEVRGWWEDAGKHWQHLADIGRLIEKTGANRP